jgi:hypothetical protein
MSRMMDGYYAAVYWGCRVESAEECARRAESFFRLLSRSEPLYSRWFEKASTRKKALQLQFEPTHETFLKFFGKKKYQGVEGFHFGAWTGHEQGFGGMISLTCGSCAESFCNVCLIYLPTEEPVVGRVLGAPVLAEVMRALGLAWEPDDGGVFSDAYEELSHEPVGSPRIGWLMYLSRRRGEVPPLPQPVRVEPVEDKGSLIILTPERFTVDNPAHVALADEVRALLDRAGLLKDLNALGPAPV